MSLTKRIRSILAAGVALSAGAAGLLAGSPAASAASTTTPSYICTNDAYYDFQQGQFVVLANGGVSHGGCVSTDARYGYADLTNEPVLSNAALVSQCKTLPALFEQLAGGAPLPVTIGSQTFSTTAALANYVFHDIFGPNPSTCAAILAADHATIAGPGAPHDVYYTGGDGANTTYAPGVPGDIAFLFGMMG